MKSSRKQKYVLIILAVLLLGLVVGYAAFSDVLTISGSASALNSFDVSFVEAEIVGTPVGVEDASIEIDASDDDRVTVEVVDLSYPGAGVQFHVKIKNNGDIPAEITSVTLDDSTVTAPIIVTGLDAISTAHPVLGAGKTCDLDFTVEWDRTQNISLDEELTSSFSLEINYAQASSLPLFEGTASHIDN